MQPLERAKRPSPRWRAPTGTRCTRPWSPCRSGTDVGLTALRVRREPRLDLAAAERAAAGFLAALGLDLESEGLSETPRRMARAFAELLTPRAFNLTTFDNTEGYDELVLARAIPIRSVCEHHLLPFVGVAHVGYLPAE
jgi:GTP cyclohydrolase IA